MKKFFMVFVLFGFVLVGFATLSFADSDKGSDDKGSLRMRFIKRSRRAIVATGTTNTGTTNTGTTNTGTTNTGTTNTGTTNTGTTNTGTTNTGTTNTGTTNTGTTNTGTTNTGTTNTGTTNTGTTNFTGSYCKTLRVATNTTVANNIRTINTNWAAIRREHSRRWQSMLINDKKKDSQKLDNANLDIIEKLQKEFEEKWLAHATGISISGYVDMIVAERTKFFTGIAIWIQSGHQSGFNAFVSDYLQMFRENKTLRLQNIVLRHTLMDACQTKKTETLLKSLNKLFEKYLKKDQRTTQQQHKRLDDLHDKIEKLQDKFNNDADMSNALEHFGDRVEEADDDNESRE